MNARRLVVVAIGAVLALELAIAVRAQERPADGPAAPRPAPRLIAGTALDRPLGHLGLMDERGRPTSLAAFRGRYLVFAPALTLCREVCPLTTGALMRVRAMLRGAGLGDRVTVAEITVDPWRDSPARLRAFKRRTGANIRFLTGSPRQISRLWHTFGVGYRRVAQERPPGRDWWTHRPETFDVVHGDGVFIVDPRGHWRAAVAGMPATHRHLPARLANMLNATGRRNLRHPDTPWTPGAIIDDLRALMGSRSSGAGDAASRARPRGGRLIPGGAQAFRRRLRALRGHPVVVNEWASWCPPCRAELPLLAEAASTFRGEVAFLGLNVNDAAASARSFLAEHPTGYPSYADPDAHAARQLASAVGLPTTVFLDASGAVTSVHMGQYADVATLDRDIRRHALAYGE